MTAVGYGVNGDRLFLAVNDPADGKTKTVEWELKKDGTFVNPKGSMLWAVSESPKPGIGGTTELLTDGSSTPSEGVSPGGDFDLPLAAAVAAGAVVALGAGGWYARRRWLN